MRRAFGVFFVAALTVGLVGCSPVDTKGSGEPRATDGQFFTMDVVHTIEVTYDSGAYEEMLATFEKSQEKDWVKADVTIDGQEFKDVGLRLKGNSSLRSLSGGDKGFGGRGGPWQAQSGGVGDLEGGGAQSGIPGDAGNADDMVGLVDEGDGTANAEEPEGLPWLIRLDKYVGGQTYSGRSDFVVRGNNTESSLNEAVALAMLSEAGVPAQQAAFTAFTINGSEPKLRLVVDVPDDELWTEDVFGGGLTYKADSGGDYSYRGDNADSYIDVFSQRSGADNMTPVIDFLDFLFNATDEEFASELPGQFDVDGFVSYLALQDLIRNSDAIDGPGNNSYLHFDEATGTMSVVAWDHNLAFGGVGGMRPGGSLGGQMGAQSGGDQNWPGGPYGGAIHEGAELPDGMRPPDGMEPPEGLEPPVPGELPGEAAAPTSAPSPIDAQSGAGQAAAELPDRQVGQERGFPNGDGGRGGPMMNKENPLVARFLENDEFKAKYEAKLKEYAESLVDSGFAEDTLDAYTSLLKEQASDLIASGTVDQDAQRIKDILAGDVEARR